MVSRSFRAAAVVATGVQSSEARFGTPRHDNDHEDWPKIAQWRCNLTALSQIHNLYFVAYSATIYVFIPRYPSHALPHKPALVVTSQPSRNGLQGYLDSRQPHAINSLVVQNLGNEEVVAAVRDDGDVDAFLVRHIVQAIERRAESDSTIGVDADEVRPIFQSNVGKSAWGLAIHSEARVIAVSANTHAITIFKFGLVSDAKHEIEQDEPRDPEAHNDRGMDVTQEVLNGTSNIPYISFCNTDDDPAGRWLLTTDITGFCRTMDLHEMQLKQTFRFGTPATVTQGAHDRFNSGWLIMFLDKKAFLPVDSAEDALGLAEGELPLGLKDNRGIWDLGGTVSNLHDVSNKFSRSKKPIARSGDLASRSTTSSPDGGVSLSSPDEPQGDDIVLESDPTPEDSVMPDHDLEFHEDDSDSGESSYLADVDFDDEGTEDTMSFSAMYGGRRICGNEPRALQPHHNLCGDIPCPILHASVRNVYLLQPSSHRQGDIPFTAPTVGFTNALHQLIPGQWAYLNIFERLNMQVYIPTIGIVVVASQKGRAIVLSLTKLSKGAHYPPEMQNRDDPAKNKTKYAMRIDHILPFASQEAMGARPFAPLAGLAAGPVQGTEHLAMEHKRWRLMMMYSDHSLLSYEISRPRPSEAVDLRNVVV